MRSLKFKPTIKRNNIELKSNTQNYRCRLLLTEFFQKQEVSDSEEFCFKNNLLLPPQNRDRELDYHGDVLNHLDLGKLDSKSRSDPSNIKKEQ